MRKYYISTSSCGSSLEEIEKLEFMLQPAERTQNPFEADVIVAPLCGLSHEMLETTAKELRLLELIHEKRPEAKIFAGGCVADAVDLTEIYPFLTGTFRRRTMTEDLRAQLLLAEAPSRKKFLPLKAGMAVIRIADGCMRHCTFCKKAYLDMELHSKPIGEIVALAKEARRKGISYLNLLAENSTEYGIDLYGKPRLMDLLKSILEAEPGMYMTLTGLAIDELTDELIAYLAQEKRVCMLQLELQSLTPTVREQMGLTSTERRVLSCVEQLRRKNLISNIMVGFPGETNQNFRSGLKLLVQHNLYFVTVDPYDNTPGTPSATLSQIPKPVVDARLAELWSDIVRLRYDEGDRLITASRQGETFPALMKSRTREDDIILQLLERPGFVRVKRCRRRFMAFLQVNCRITGIGTPFTPEQFAEFEGEIC